MSDGNLPIRVARGQLAPGVSAGVRGAPTRPVGPVRVTVAADDGGPPAEVFVYLNSQSSDLRVSESSDPRARD